jgi:hypothetical protein
MTDTEELSTLTDPVQEPPASEPTPTLTPNNIGKLQVIKAEAREPFINLLIYGHSGAGKTRLAASACEVEAMSPVLVVDVEGGTFSIRDLYPQVDVVRVKSFADMQEIYEAIHDKKVPYKTVVLDSLTEMQKFSMSMIMRDLIRKEPDRDPDIPSVREWGKNIEQIRRVVRAFRDLEINTIFTALVSEERNTRSGLVDKKPYLSGKLAHEVAGFLDIVVYYYTKLRKEGDEMITMRLLLTSMTEDTVAKDRSDKLPMILGAERPPVMQDLYDYILGGKPKA